MEENRQDLLVADRTKFISQQGEIARQYLAGKLTTSQLQELIEGRNPFAANPLTKPVSLIQAKQILGKANVMGFEEIYKAFGILLTSSVIPDIPFSLQELQNARRLKQLLILRIPRHLNGNGWLTIQNLNNLCQPKFKEHKNGKVLYDISWYKNEKFYTTATPRPGWYLVERNPVKASLDNKNFLEQTKLIVKHLTTEIFTNQLPPVFQSAISEFEQDVDQIEELMKTNWQAAAKRFADLSINQLCRRTPVEIVYDFLIVFLNNKEKLLENYYDWTPSLDVEGKFVLVGYGDACGLDVVCRTFSYYKSNIGCCLSYSQENSN